jgi:multiple sugar transport system permease protein
MTEMVKNRRRKTIAMRNNIEGYAFITPALFGLVVFLVYPILQGFYISLHNWSVLEPPSWAGISNYVHMFKDEVFLISLGNTLLWVAIYVPASIVVSFLLALALNMHLKGIKTFRAIFYVPVVTPLLVVALMFVWMYNTDFGIINYVLYLIGLGPVPWLTNKFIALPAIALMSIWKNCGYNMVIILAALQGIPVHLTEAAMLDGITPWKKTWHITIPLITPALYYILVMAIIDGFQVFTEIYIMTSGGPGYATHTLSYYMWKNAFSYYQMGYASAISVFMFVIILLITLIQSKFLGSRVQYDL